VAQDGGKGKGKAVPLQDWSGPDGSRKLRFPDYVTVAHDDGKGKGKAVPLQAWSGSEGSRKLRFLDYMQWPRMVVKVKVKQSRYRPGVAQRVPGS
jgi:hypothetical protein